MSTKITGLSMLLCYMWNIIYALQYLNTFYNMIYWQILLNYIILLLYEILYHHHWLSSVKGTLILDSIIYLLSFNNLVDSWRTMHVSLAMRQHGLLGKDYDPRARICIVNVKEPRNRFRQAGINSWAPKKLNKYGLSTSYFSRLGGWGGRRIKNVS